MSIIWEKIALLPNHSHSLRKMFLIDNHQEDSPQPEIRKTTQLVLATYSPVPLV